MSSSLTADTTHSSMVELADTHALGACAEEHVSSNLTRGTKKNLSKFGILKSFPYICRVEIKNFSKVAYNYI